MTFTFVKTILHVSLSGLDNFSYLLNQIYQKISNIQVAYVRQSRDFLIPSKIRQSSSIRCIQSTTSHPKRVPNDFYVCQTYFACFLEWFKPFPMYFESDLIEYRQYPREYGVWVDPRKYSILGFCSIEAE